MGISDTETASPPYGSAVLPEKAVISRFVSRTRIDTWTAEVVTAFREQGIPAVLLKGPATARWLYTEDPSARTYSDVDLMVGPGRLRAAEYVLRSMGFVEPDHPSWLISHARCWLRGSDGANVDLHRTLHGMETVPTDCVWAAVTEDAELCVVGGVQVDIPGPVVRTLHVVLHALPGDDHKSKPCEDLRRAIALVDESTWRAAASLARRLGVDDEMGQRLRQMADGIVLADKLGLPVVGSLWSFVATGMEQSQLPQSAHSFWCLASRRGLGPKARWIVQRQFPSRPFMERHYPLARRGVVGFIASYGVRSVETCTRLPGAVRHWVRFNRELRRGLGGQRPRR